MDSFINCHRSCRLRLRDVEYRTHERRSRGLQTLPVDYLEGASREGLGIYEISEDGETFKTIRYFSRVP